MGKASTRRKRRRQGYLERLARENPKKFLSEWAKRLESWSEEAAYCAGRLADREGTPIPPAFMLVGDAIGELAACGEAAFELESEATEAVMNAACCKAIATAMDSRMYWLSNARSNQKRMEAGTHKPPR